MDRRRALTWVVRGIGVIAGGIALGPALATLVSPARGRERVTWVPVGPLADFPVGATSAAAIAPPAGAATRTTGPVGVYVRRGDDGQTAVLSRSCTDLGCPVNHDPGSGWFFCPCHGGIFDAEGEPVAGPPSRPLDRYRTRLRGDVLEVDLASVPPMV